MISFFFSKELIPKCGIMSVHVCTGTHEPVHTCVEARGQLQVLF